MAAILHAVPLSGVCRKGRSSPVPQVRERPEEMRCAGSKRTRELGRDMLLAASIVKFFLGTRRPIAQDGRNRPVSAEKKNNKLLSHINFLFLVEIFLESQTLSWRK